MPAQARARRGSNTRPELRTSKTPITVGAMGMERPATLDDVAQEAGVSRATVDRVINKRPGVRPPTILRVETAMRKLSYRPDPIAGRLARRSRFRFRFILPTGSNTFMGLLGEQIAVTADWLARHRGFIDVVRVDVFDARALAAELAATDRGYQGVAVVALDDPLVRGAIDDLVTDGVAVVTLVSDVPSSKRLRFIGIDNSAAGRTAGSLLGRFVGGRKGTVGVIAGSMALRDHVERVYGFGRVLAANFPNLTLLPVCEVRDDRTLAKAAVLDLLRDHEDLVGLYNVGGGQSGVGEALQETVNEPGPVVIVHELTSATRRHLLAGHFAAAIGQDPGHEARSAARVLMAYATGESIMHEQERIGIDIFVRDNLP